MQTDRSSPTEEGVQVAISDDRSVTAVLTIPDGPRLGRLFVYAPGAGSNINDRFGVYACRRLAAQGFTTVRFQFPYMEARRRRPDRTPLLEETWRHVIAMFRDEGLKLVVGGRSMGGRIASQVVAQGTIVDSLALFAYPLRPPTSPSQWRDKHLPAIMVPTLFCSGTRDAFASPDELRTAASMVPQSKIKLLDDADHGFETLKSSERTRRDVWAEAIDALVDWLGEEPFG